MAWYLILTVAVGKGGAIAGWVLGWPFWPMAALFILPDFIVAWHIFMPGAQGMGRVFTRFETSGKEVWLTIDDGPDAADTPLILDLLDRFRAKASFFVIGEKAARLPALVSEIQTRGHEVAHHTHTHPARWFWCATPWTVKRELDRPLEALAAVGARPRRFRPPVGIRNVFLDRALRRRSLAHVGWTVRSWDSVREDPREVVELVMSRVRPGAILLVHEGPLLHPAVRVQAIAGILEALSAQGFICVVPEDTRLR